MQKDIENTLMKSNIENKMVCPFCEKLIGWRSVASFYTSTIGAKNPGRKLSKEEATAMINKRWKTKKENDVATTIPQEPTTTVG